MRLNGSKWQQLVFVILTITCALALGYIAAVFTGGNATPTLATNLTLPSSAPETASATTAEASPSPRATSRPAPTATRTAPTPSVTARPSATPTISATAELAQSELFIAEDFGATTSGFPKRETETWSAGVVDGRYQLTLNGQTSIGFTTPMPAQNYRLSIDLNVAEGGAGLVFLYTEPATTYRILITPDGAYALERQNDAEATKLVGWTESPALNRGPEASNQLQIERRGDKVRFYANEQLLTEYTISAGAFENRYGFVLTSKSGQGRATFDNLRGERLPD